MKDFAGPGPVPPAPSGAPLPVVFTGTARAYFRIWLVNLLLSLATIGIWSAWAKVRRRRYFLGNTQVGGATFEYLATGLTLLKGRLIVVAALALYAGLQAIEPRVSWLLGLGYVVVLPWLIVRSLAFNARNTQWCAVRFGFRARWWDGFVAAIAMPFLALISLGLLLPVSTRRTATFWVNGHRLGAAAFSSAPPLAPLYRALGLALAVFMGMTALAGGAVWGGALALALAPGETGLALNTLPLVGLLVIFPAFLFAGALYRARLRNTVLGAMTLEGGHRFRSTLSAPRFAWIVLSNMVVTVLSLGLAHPWAAIRLWRYQCACLTVIPAGPLDAFIEARQAEGNVIASEFSDLEGFEVGL
ncbi:YjgN family protein [Rhodospirillum rubrum]|uniref:DUF898 domain-containing protein n=1 Tax=Rhodospirillum rubrum (strain ATCC 11170 / ATH 1.1.1 / DSM 467 / LMG 4362 / NCIMB 8255 / S1) TaxID=269796 RepID=Q2RXT3_RHORT|nr:YjgN family protein [Rhodospirillum rubrum]ABC21062.1 Protein of unknown function DUF898 [Rhodospirillum rubrum ATCC 11170]AEO46730.1 hypothetical protein F11_01300 [Rhodospirillum rubrum F11]MBK5952606.1 hypothetical protein [Rhodospirillum rubrum]QXG80755.1 DUF898 domain-containing protein [Rhodospirillum rubrum]HAP98942.1 DUF898 domain-containing protein [Rhodospirillum rubrum]